MADSHVSSSALSDFVATDKLGLLYCIFLGSQNLSKNLRHVLNTYKLITFLVQNFS